MTALIVEWLATYALHSFVMLGAVYCLERVRVLVELDVRESAWRVAMFAPLITAILHVAYPQPDGRPIDAVESSSATASITASREIVKQPTRPLDNSAAQPGYALQLPMATRAVESEMYPRVLRIPLNASQGLVLVGWIAASGTGVILLGWQFMALRRRFARVRECRDPALITEAAEIADRAGVRLTGIKQFAGESTALVIPPATLCVPDWAVSGLDPLHRRAMIAHEVAHILRRDPIWRLVTRACARIFFFQPLNWLAIRRLDEIAELACDAWAAAASDRRALVECLVLCGERLVSGRHPSFVNAMAVSRSTLLDRIQALFQGAPRLASRVATGRIALGAILLGVLSMPVLVFDETSQAAERESRTDRGSVDDWSLDEFRGSGLRVRSRSGFFGLGGRETTMKVTVPGAELGARINGDVKFSAAEDSVESIEGTLVIEEKRDATVSRIEVKKDDEAIQHRYEVNEQPRPFEPEGRQFMARTVPVLLRETGYDAKARVDRLLERGVSALLAEVELMHHDFARRIYLTELVGRKQLAPDELTRVINVTRTMKSDFERRLVLRSTLEKQVVANADMIQILDVVASMNSDFEQRLVLTKLAEQLSVGDEPGLTAAWSKALGTLRSDFESRLVIAALAKSESLAPALATSALETVANIESDFEARLALSSLVPHVVKTPSLARTYIASSDRIGSDFEKRLALTRLVKDVALDAQTFKAVLDTAKDINSKFECNGVLRALLERLPADQEVIDLYRQASKRCNEA